MKLLKNLGLNCGGTRCSGCSEEKVKVGWVSKDDLPEGSPLELGSNGMREKGHSVPGAGTAGAKAGRDGFRIRRLPIEKEDIGWRRTTDSCERQAVSLNLMMWEVESHCHSLSRMCFGESGPSSQGRVKGKRQG